MVEVRISSTKQSQSKVNKNCEAVKHKRITLPPFSTTNNLPWNSSDQDYPSSFTSTIHTLQLCKVLLVYIHWLTSSCAYMPFGQHDIWKDRQGDSYIPPKALFTNAIPKHCVIILHLGLGANWSWNNYLFFVFAFHEICNIFTEPTYVLPVMARRPMSFAKPVQYMLHKIAKFKLKAVNHH